MSGPYASAFPLGSLAGVPIRLHVTFPLVFLAALLANGASQSWSIAVVGWSALLYGPILLATVLTHELGHSLAAKRVGGHVEGILLWPLGGLAYLAHSNGPKADLVIALAGPLTHVPQLLLWLACLIPAHHAAYGSWSISLSIPSPNQHFILAVIAGACQLNIGLAAFNLLLPAYPLDGGRILADVLLLAGVQPDPAARVTAGVAAVLGVAVVGLGVWRWQVLTMVVGGWMLHSTWQLWQAIRAQVVQQHPMFNYSAAQEAEAGGAPLLPGFGKTLGS